ncbi:hypothetical protein N9A67_01195 [Rhodobacteraceae bacterium]|nr:hypothetical protein [Paracoccaceae bacterium]
MSGDLSRYSHLIEFTGVKSASDGEITRSTLRFLGSQDLLISAALGTSASTLGAVAGTLEWAGMDGQTIFVDNPDAQATLNTTVVQQSVYLLNNDHGSQSAYVVFTNSDMTMHAFSILGDGIFEDGFSTQKAEALFTQIDAINANEQFAAMTIIIDGQNAEDGSTLEYVGSLADLERTTVTNVPEPNEGKGVVPNVSEGDGIIWGTDGNDDLFGTDLADVIKALDGDDTVHAGAGDDMVYGHAGNDFLYGEDGNDTVWASDGDDLVQGGTGDDRLGAGHGSDTVDGGDGNDTIVKISGDGALYGGAGDDILIGGYQNDHIYGGSGADWIRGDISDLIGGIDIIDGGAGDDTLSGGKSADSFVFRPHDGNDIIARFELNRTSVDAVINEAAEFTRDWDALDQIHLIGFDGISHENVMSYITQSESGAIFSHQGTTIEFFGVSVDELSAGDFYFG